MALILIDPTVAAVNYQPVETRLLSDTTPQQLLVHSRRRGLSSKHLIEVPTLRIEWPRLNAPITQASARLGRVKIGDNRVVPATYQNRELSAQATWQQTSDGNYQTHLLFYSPGAAALRLNMVFETLPETATFTFTSDADPLEYKISGAAIVISRQPILTTALKPANKLIEWWSPSVAGDTLNLQIQLDASQLPTALAFTIPQLAHLYENYSELTPSKRLSAKIAEPENCELDVSCYDTTDIQGNDAKNGIARMEFQSFDGSYKCTGSLIGDRAGSRIPYLLTAHHCISDANEAASLQTYWFYYATQCNGSTLNPAHASRQGGAELLLTFPRDELDMSLLRLRETPPAGATFLGWSPEAVNSGPPAAVLHHPNGALQKISLGAITGFQHCTWGYDDFYCMTDPAGEHIEIIYEQGMTEAGSSGAGLFTDHYRYLVGTLSGGDAGCNHPADYYSRFDRGYQQGIKAYLETSTCSTASKLWMQKSYIGYYNRCSDAPGFDYWCQRLDQAGGDLSSIIAAFGTSAEYTENFTYLRDEDLINNLYENMFERGVEANGLTFYLGLLEQHRQTWQQTHANNDEGATEYVVSRIALDILNGAQGSDLDRLNTKVAACPMF